MFLAFLALTVGPILVAAWIIDRRRRRGSSSESVSPLPEDRGEGSEFAREAAAAEMRVRR